LDLSEFLGRAGVSLLKAGATAAIGGALAAVFGGLLLTIGAPMLLVAGVVVLGTSLMAHLKSKNGLRSQPDKRCT